MEDLLPYYERELAFLRRYSRDFAERYPKIAGRLLLVGDVSEDPHVERLIESFALMGARISKKIEDDYPEFTEALLEVLYPHYLRPFPSCSIARFDLGQAGAQLSAPVTIPRGTELLSRPVRGGPCRFRTAYDVVLAPLRIAAAQFLAVAQVPSHVRLPPQAGAQITLRFELQSQHPSLEALGVDKVRAFIDGEPSFCAVLRDVLALKVEQAWVEPEGSGRWTRLDTSPLAPVGMADDEALIDYPARSHPAYRLLTELFAFPEKFGFFDIDLRRAGKVGGKRFALHLILRDVAADSVPARLLETLSPANVALGCTPVVNLFRQRAEPIRVTHAAVSYPVVADARRAYAFEVHSIDSVARVQQTAQGESIVEFRPFYSLRHGESPEHAGQYWVTHRNEAVARQSPGYELELSMVDVNFDPVMPQTDVLSLELTCSNRDLPSQLAYGVPGGDLTMEGGSVARSISLLRKPTPSLRFDAGRGAQWRLISHLSLNHISLVEGGATALKEMLRLYDLPRSPISSRMIEGIAGLAHQAVTAWLPGRHFASVARGTEIRLSIDEDHFVGTGIHAFASVLDHFFGLYVHANSFTQLVLLSSRSGEELIRCPARSGESTLV
ncbi:type VI secretion system baseplate subunit TssF [Fulvimonas sp. R45]|uniref:type VI secretion system baseplate subunit TssF n=1 Tax=Fulvimonas sp. R45 TaxID=3045937 RepID=UPI00265E775A|nr:type VI secretion system baseplate subunit TssF [Fulvimonas sp. R45]MDO1530423.1 type VI secretion system baseplate subunit TssF [Fulvimonas sp. R45]